MSFTCQDECLSQVDSALKAKSNISDCAGYDFLRCANCVRDLRCTDKSTATT